MRFVRVLSLVFFLVRRIVDVWGEVVKRETRCEKGKEEDILKMS